MVSRNEWVVINKVVLSVSNGVIIGNKVTDIQVASKLKKCSENK